MRRRLRRNGNSWSLPLQKILLEHLGIDPAQGIDVILELSDGTITIRNPSHNGAPKREKPTKQQATGSGAILAAYKQHCEAAGMPAVLTDANGGAKSQALRKKMAEAHKRERMSKEEWQSYMQRAASSSFLRTGNGSKWRGANLIWLIGPNNKAKVDAGAYDDRPVRQATTTTTTNYGEL